MARIRTIKPTFWSHGTIMELSLNARLLFIGSWNFADDYGNLDRSAKQLKARVFPGDNIDCDPLIKELIAHGRFIEYSVNGKNYLHIHKFNEHQVINRKGEPQCPVYERSLSVHGTVLDESVTNPAGREGKGKEGNGEEHVGAGAPPADTSPVIETLPLINGKDFEVRQSLVAELEPIYPKVDVPATVREMKGWLIGNPARRKTRTGIKRFITTWLHNEQQKAEAQ